MKVYLYPSGIDDSSPLILKSQGLIFEVQYKKMQSGEHVYFSFDVLP